MDMFSHTPTSFTNIIIIVGIKHSMQVSYLVPVAEVGVSVGSAAARGCMSPTTTVFCRRSASLVASWAWRHTSTSKSGGVGWRGRGRH